MNFWYLTKAEVGYNKARLIWASALTLILSFGLILGSRGENARQGLYFILFISSIMAIMGGERIRLAEKLDRRDPLLALPAWQLALSRYTYPAVCWAVVLMSMMSILLMWSLAGFPASNYLTASSVLAMNGVLALIVGVGRCLSDLRSWIESKNARNLLWVLWKVVAMTTVVPFYILANARAFDLKTDLLDSFLTFMNGWGAVYWLNGLGLLSLGLGFWINQHKDNQANP